MHHALPPSPALLPAGFDDILPPEAEGEWRSVVALLETFAGHGYRLVAPPLAEFEEALLAGSGQAVADQCFRLMDPDSRRMLALRADLTPQIARIAQTRLAAAPRPLRLAYFGPCLRVTAPHMAPARQLDQAGIELIGADCAEADALAAIGLTRVSIDLTMPPLVPSLLAAFALPASACAAITRALDRKDVAAMQAEAGALAPVLETLLLAAGRPARAFGMLHGLKLPADAAAHAARL
ncbi:MAG: ATP phosphoribosyltransferase regulatory subunit, partial [Acidocella sp.]|nr:ATP phosphoribosyltransferase regulatory subunit [Acidocella sp.]